MDKGIEHIFLTFIILVLAIGIGYWLNVSRTRTNEGFDSTEPETTQPLGTIPQGTTPLANPNTLSAAISNQLSGITDSTMQATLQTQLTNLQSLLNRYAALDIPLVMNDAGQVCSMWGDYAGGRYRQQQNQCQALDNTNILKCLDTTATPSTCGNILADGYITSKSSINFQPLLDNATSKVMNAIPNITSQVATMDQSASSVITSLADRSSIQLQQQDIITNNNENMAYKNKIMNDNTEKLSKKQNETNINQNNFTSFMDQITNVNSTSNTYYKIIIGLIIAIVVMGILNFLFSNILA